MEDYEIEEVAKILTEWNPLGDDALKRASLTDGINGGKASSTPLKCQVNVFQ